MTSEENREFRTSWRQALGLSPFLLFICVSAITASVLLLKFAQAPFFWIWLTWAVACWAAMFGVRGSWPRAVLFNFGILAVLLAIAEGYLVEHEYTGTIFSSGFTVHDDVLGWAPAKGIQAHAFKVVPAGVFRRPTERLFDVYYTIGSDGLRIAPPLRKNRPDGTALFFGCSFTFGEGLRDSETLPYQVGVQSGEKFRIYNLAFEAYGPNQMLAAIEDGRVQRLVVSPPQYAYYVALPIHVWRVAGKVAWGGHAPHYALDSEGSVYLAGHFDTEPLDERLGLHHGVGVLKKSAIWRMFESIDSPITDDDIRLYFAVVRRSQELLQKQFPGIQFRVILWPNQHAAQQFATYQKLRDGFRNMGIPLDLVDEILPGYDTDRSPYILGSADHHPNALANRLIAQKVASELAQ